METDSIKRSAGCLIFLGLISGLRAGAEPPVQGWVRLTSGQAASAAQVMLFDLTDLRQVADATTDETGWFALSAEPSAPALPERLSLGQNYPNPFNPSTIIPFQLPVSTHVRLEIFNLLGQRVTILVDEDRPAGSHTAHWDGTNATGRPVGSGVYLYRLQGGGMSATHRMVLVDGHAGVLPPNASSRSKPSMGEATPGAPVHGLTVSGRGLITYVDPAFRVQEAIGPLDLVVEEASAPRGKVTTSSLLGDVDNNGRVDIVDALLVALYILDSSIVIPNNGDISRGDVNSDGRIDSADLVLILTLYVLAETGTPATPGGEPLKMYWTAEGPPRIQRANLDGSHVEDLVTTGLANPRGLALDAAGGKMYWLDRGTDKLQRANLDGSNVQDLVTTGLVHPLSLALDVSAGKMYWLDHSTAKIQRANLDGSNVEDLVNTGRQPEGLALDVAAGKMYWMTVGTDRIQRANLDGSNVEDLVTTGLDAPSGLALDLATGKMYWTDSGTDKIQRANLDGSNVEDLVTTGLLQPEEFALDVAAGKMYWADSDSDKIQRANLDGSNVEDLVTGLNVAYGLALDITTAGGQSPGTATLLPDPSTVVFENDGKWRAFTVQAGEPVVVVANPSESAPRIESTDTGSASNLCPAESEDEVARQDGEAIYLAGCSAGRAIVQLRRASGLTLLRTYSFTIEEAPPATPGTGVSKMYWTSRDKIQRADRDGSNVEDLITFGSPRGLALDMQGGKIYWTDQGTRKIWRAELDGSQVEGVITFGLISPVGLALDVDGGKIYWTDSGFNKIQRANLDGSRVENLVSIGLHSPEGLALDADGGKIYWSDFGTNKIQRANLDGSRVEDLVTTGLRSPEGLALDVGAGKIYWADYSTDKIQRANLDGSNVEDLLITGLSIAKGLALDVEAGKMYWTDSGTNKIQRADLNGSDVEDLLSGQSSAPLGLTLDSPVALLSPNPSEVTFARDGTKHRFTVRASEPITVVANPAGAETRMLVAESSGAFNECPAESEDTMTRRNGQTVYLAGCEPGQATVELRRASDQEVLRTYTFNVSGAVKIYWVDAYEQRIHRANLNGSNSETLVTGLGAPIGLALDVMGQKMYWTDKGTDKIHRANLDGSNTEDLVSELREPRRVALDLGGGKMYWPDATTDKIQRSNLDGTGIEDLVTGLREPVGLVLDLIARKIYWADSTTDRIHRANFDGSHIENILTAGIREPRGLALDILGGKIYWSDNGTDGIHSVNLDGTHAQKLLSAVTPIGVALAIPRTP